MAMSFDHLNLDGIEAPQERENVQVDLSQSVDGRNDNANRSHQAAEETEQQLYGTGMDRAERGVSNGIAQKKQISVIGPAPVDLPLSEAQTGREQDGPVSSRLHDGGSFRDVGRLSLPPLVEDAFMVGDAPEATSAAEVSPMKTDKAAALSGEVLTPTPQVSPSPVTLAAASGEMTTAGTGGMIVDYIGQTIMEEAPDPAYTYRLGQITMWDPEDLPIRGFSISQSSAPGAFKIAKIDTETGPQWYLEVNDASKIDYEASSNHQITLQIAGTSFDGDVAYLPLTITLTNRDEDGNEAPDNLTLSNTTIDENSAAGTNVGYLQVSDIDLFDGHIFQIIGDPDNKFEVVPDMARSAYLRLKAGATLNYETATSHQVTVRVTDSGGLTYDRSFTIGVNDLEPEENYAPWDIFLNDGRSASLDEGAGGRPVGTLRTYDRNGGETFTYQIVNDPDGKFEVVGDQLRVRASAALDYEAKATHYVTVRVTDAGGLTAEKVFTVSVRNINERPNDILLSGTSIAEKSPAGTVIGDLSASDPDGTDQTLTYSITSDPDQKFVIENNQLKLRPNATLDYEVKASHAVTITVKDQGGQTFAKTFSIAVTDVAEAPHNLQLSAAQVDENSPVGTVVGILSGVDQDSTNFTYTLASDPDGKFQIVGNQLQVRDNANLNFEGKKIHFVVVRVTDEAGLSFDKQFQIDVRDANDAPYNINLGPASIAENTPGGTRVGFLSTTDQDNGVGDTHAYSILWDPDNKFDIVGSELRLKANATLDYEVKRQHSVTIRTTDRGGATYDKTFNVVVNNVNETPTDLTLSNRNIAEGTPAGTVIGLLQGVDPDGGNSISRFTYAIVDDPDQKFAIASGSNQLTIRPGAVLDYEVKTSHQVKVKVTDITGLSYEKTFTINVIDVNEEQNHAPTNILLSNNTVSESVLVGSAIGTLTGQDPDPGATFTYAVVDDPSGKFEVRPGTNELRLKANATLDFETSASHQLVVRVTDETGLSYLKTFVINVTNVNEAPTDITLSGTHFVDENAPLGTLIGELQALDPDFNNSFTYAVLGNPPQFRISGTQLQAGPLGLDYETGSSHTITIRAFDQNLLYVDRVFTINLNDVNDTPHDLTLSGSAVDENSAGGMIVGVLQGQDQDPGATFTYELVADLDNKFRLVDNQLQVREGAGLNYETKQSHQVTIRVTDQFGKSFQKTFIITVNNVEPEQNHAPTNILLSNASINENSDGGTLVGLLTGLDQDGGDFLTYSVAGDPDGKFALVNNRLVLKDGATLDWETKTSHQVTIRVTDRAGATFDKTFTITVNNTDDGPNTAPTGLVLSNSAVDENSASGTVIGILSAIDPDGHVLYYAVSADPDGKFAVVNNQLVVRPGATLDYEAKSQHEVTVKAYDRFGAFTEQTFTITVNNLDEPNRAPVDLLLSNTAIDENSAAGTVIGNLSTVDPDLDDTSFTYFILGDPDGKFAIINNQLVLKAGATLNFETKTSHEVLIQAKDQDGGVVQRTFTITVNNLEPEINYAPTDIRLSKTSVRENVREGVVFASISAVDQNGGDTFTYSIVEDPDSKFMVIDNQLAVRPGATLDFEDKQSHQITLRVTDAAGATYDETFTITVIDEVDEVNHAPHGLLLSNSSVAEHSEWGTVIGVLTGLDRDGGDVLRYSIFDDPDGKFALADGNKLVVRERAFIDYETQVSHQLTVRVTDAAGVTYDKVLTIDVTNVDESTNHAPINLVLSNSSILEGTGGPGGTLVGVVSATDPDGDRLIYTLDPHEKFELVGNEIRLREGQAVDYDEAQSYELWGYAFDRFGAMVEQQFIINVVSNRGPNRAPTDVTLSNMVVREGELNGFTIGRLSANDLDYDQVSFSLIDNAGGRFVLAQEDGHTVLKVANGAKIDYEQLPRLSIEVRADDGHGGVTDQVMQIDVRNVLNESLHGTEGADRMQGGISHDEFWGMGGNDTLIGGAGNDTLWGGEGEDTFVLHRFGTGNSDLIKDFDAAQDKIVLVQSNAATALNVGVLSSEAFCYGTQAADADDRIIYDLETGRLLYDSDGSGGRAAFEVAIFENRAVLDHTHFAVSQFLI